MFYLLFLTNFIMVFVLRITEVNDGHQIIKSVSSGRLLNRTPVTGDDVERVSTGTKFALQHWLTAAASTT